MARIAWTDVALDDLEAIARFIRRDAPRRATLFADRVRHQVGRLAEFPRSGRVVPEIGRDDVREILVDRYRILYRVRLEEDLVEILTIRHGAQMLRDFTG